MLCDTNIEELVLPAAMNALKSALRSSLENLGRLQVLKSFEEFFVVVFVFCPLKVCLAVSQWFPM